MKDETVPWPLCGKLDKVKICSRQGYMCAIMFKFKEHGNQCPMLSVHSKNCPTD